MCLTMVTKDSELPWDPFWEYVLGEGDDDDSSRRRRRERRRKSQETREATQSKSKSKRFWSRRSSKKEQSEVATSSKKSDATKTSPSWGISSAFDSFISAASEDESVEQRDDDTRASSRRRSRKGRFWSRKKSSEGMDYRDGASTTGSKRSKNKSHRRAFSDESDSLFDLSVDESTSSRRSRKPQRSKSLVARRKKSVTGNPFEDRMRSNSDDESERQSLDSYSDDETDNTKRSFVGELLHPFLGGSSESEDSSEIESHSEDSSEEDGSYVTIEDTPTTTKAPDNEKDLSSKADNFTEVKLLFNPSKEEPLQLDPNHDSAGKAVRGLPDEQTEDFFPGERDTERALFPVLAMSNGTPSIYPPHEKRAFSRAACLRNKKKTPEMLEWQQRTGLPIEDLSPAQLSSLFPKMRIVSDGSASGSHSLLGKGETFEKSVPANLQLSHRTLNDNNQPHSLYEYDYDSSSNMHIVYETFSRSPRDVLRVESIPIPSLSSEDSTSNKDVVLQVEASSISMSDCLIRRGQWWGECDSVIPNTPGVDTTGMIYEISFDTAKAFGLRKGDRVTTLVKWGGNSRFIKVCASDLVKVPSTVDPAQATCLMETYLTAFQATHYGQSPGRRYKAGALKGKTLLVLCNASSNLMKAIAELSLEAKAKTLYAPSKERYFQQLSNLGISVLNIDSEEEWLTELHGKIDLVISVETEILPYHYGLLSDQGEIVVVSRSDKIAITDPALRSQPTKRACSRLLAQQRSRTYIYDLYWEWDGNKDRCKKDLGHLIALLERGRICPQIIDRIPLSKVPRAQELIETKTFSGFLVCEPWLVTKSRAIRL